MTGSSNDVLHWSVVVPVKVLSRAKSRLTTRSGTERADLARAFALDVLDACQATPAVLRTLVVTDDEQVATLVRSRGVQVLTDPTQRLGRSALNSAALAGAQAAIRNRPDLPVAILAADLPALRPAVLAQALRIAAPHASAFVSDSAGIGTTMLTSAPGHAPDPRFGVRSRAAHAAAGSVEIAGPDLSRLRCDVDGEVDLWHAVALGVGQHTGEVLDRIGTPGRSS